VDLVIQLGANCRIHRIEQTTSFYGNVMGMKKEVFGKDRVALRFGDQKINLHGLGKELEPKAHIPLPGSADLCLLTPTPRNEAMAHVKNCGADVLKGPVERTGATGPIRSFYIRDPDLNLIEVANKA
jgi:catechol 2,3-dioxygenase-like lactoylglutathione lyase family enzyme